MATTLYYHPYSRASNVIWMLEEVGIPYELEFVDLFKGKHKQPEILEINPMGKLPILQDDDLVVTESAAIGLYLADRYAAGRLAPTLNDPARGTYLRWSLFAPSILEPGVTAKSNKWDFKEAQVGWGNYESMLTSMEHAIHGKKFVLGEQFSMADIIFGGTIRFMLQFKILEAKPSFSQYVARLNERPALQKADALNAAQAKEHGLG